MNSELIAILTADVVDSRKIPQKDLSLLFEIFNQEIVGKLKLRKGTFEFFRGDSFQGKVPIEESLRIALLWRSAFKSRQQDIRLAVGIGRMSYNAKSTAVSGGEAFELSGSYLDDLKLQQESRMGIVSTDERLNICMQTSCILAEAIISRWSDIGAETIYNMLLQNNNQDSLALRFGVTQPAIHKRLQAANWPAIKKWELNFRTMISQITIDN